MTSSNGDIKQDKCKICQQFSSLKCSNCVKAFYCSVAHQKQDWKKHKPDCHPFEVTTKQITYFSHIF